MQILKKPQLALCSLLAMGKKGQGTLDSVIAVVVGAVSLVVGIIIVGELFAGYDWETQWPDSAANNATREAFNTTEQMTWTAIGILPIILLVMAAVAVIGAVLVLRGRR